MVKLTFLGDTMCKPQMLETYKTDNGYNFDSIFVKMKDYFKNSDYVLANLETPVSFDNSDLTTQRFRFNAPYEFAESTFNSGIKFVSTANNHCLDNGIDGIKSTIKALNKIGLKHTGVFADNEKELTVLNINGLKFGMLSYTYGTNAFSNNVYLKAKDKYMVNLFQNQELSNPILRYGYHKSKSLSGKIINKIMRKFKFAQYDKQVYERTQNDKAQKRKLKAEIKALKDLNIDFLIMYMHSGGQYNSKPTEYTKRLTEYLFNNGVDIIAGSHEHVVHGGDFSKISKGKLATYSLGNFVGIAGVYDVPFDKMAEYSIAWNIYFDEINKNIEKTTFSVLKTIELSEKYIQTVPVYDLILSAQDKDEKQAITKDALKIAKIFSGKEYKEVQQEFSI